MRLAPATILLLALPVNAAAQGSTGGHVPPAPSLTLYLFLAPFAFAFVVGGLAIGAGFRNKVVQTVTNGILGTILGAAVSQWLAPYSLILLVPAWIGMVALGWRRYVRLFNDRSVDGTAWQWSKPRYGPQRYNLRAGRWEEGSIRIRRMG